MNNLTPYWDWAGESSASPFCCVPVMWQWFMLAFRRQTVIRRPVRWMAIVSLVAPQSMWLGTKKSGSVWQTTFAEPTQIGSILQINSDDPHQLKNAPRNYSWQVSDDGEQWTLLQDTVVLRENRLFRIHRLKQAVTTKHIRLVVNLSHGSAPALREVEFYPAVDAEIPFPEWIVAVSSDEDPDNVSLGMPFISLARLCDGWQNVPAQTIWHGDFDPEFAFAEPRPLCAFLSGSFLEWCQCSREPWRGTQEVLKSRRLPMWGACGGAQVLAILEETGVDQPWTVRVVETLIVRCCPSIRTSATREKLPVEIIRSASASVARSK